MANGVSPIRVGLLYDFPQGDATFEVKVYRQPGRPCVPIIAEVILESVAVTRARQTYETASRQQTPAAHPPEAAMQPAGMMSNSDVRTSDR